MTMYKRIAAAVLAVTALAGGEDFNKQAISFRLLKTPREYVRGWALEVDTEGFRFERFGGGGKRDDVPWGALLREDARRLRLHFEIDWIKDVAIERVPGHRLELVGGGQIEGLLVRIDKQKRHWLKTEGAVMPYPGDRIQRIEETQLDETRVYNNEEVYLRRLERRPPATAAEHRDLADYMFDLGNWAKAAEHYRAAMAGQPLWTPELGSRVEEVIDILKDERASKVFSKAKFWAVLQGDFERARGTVEEYVAAHPEARRRGDRVLDQIAELRGRKLRQQFHRVKNEEFDRTVRRYLDRQKPDFATALAWLEKQMQDAVEKRVRNRLGIGADEYADLVQTPAPGAPHFATYWSGTFIIQKRAKGKNPRQDPESWWSGYPQTQTRATWMKAYAAERTPELFQVVNVRFKDCERCGGKGFVKKLNLNPRGNSPAEWNEICPRCFGAKRDRAVAYR